MRDFIENCGHLKGLSASRKDYFAKYLEACMAQPCELGVSYGHFLKWLDGYPREDRYEPPADLAGLRQAAFANLLTKAVLDAWLMTNERSSGADRLALRKFNGESFAHDLIEAGLAPSFAHDEGIACHIPFDEHAAGEDTISVGSSNGVIFADREGYVIGVDAGWKDADADIPAKFDFAEYERHYGHGVPDAVDILDLGFASWDGEIVEPAHDWREMMAADLKQG